MLTFDVPISTKKQTLKRYALLVDTSRNDIISLQFESIAELITMVLHHPQLKLYRTQYEIPSVEQLSDLVTQLHIREV